MKDKLIFAGVVIVAILAVSIIAYTIYDRITGETKLVMGSVIDKYVVRTTHTTGKTTSTNEDHYIIISTDNGITDKLSMWESDFFSYKVGERVVVRFTIGGHSKSYYMVGITKYNGMESK